MAVKPKTPDARVEKISPAGAKRLLEGNLRNRNLRKERVQQLAGAMQRGEWELNGETIKLASDGTLIDGQHRLEAIRESGKTIRVLVVRNLPLEAQDTVDTGKRRRLADVLKIEGYPDAHALAATVNVLHRYREKERIDYSHRNAPSAQQAMKLLDEAPSLRNSVGIARGVARKIGGPIGVFAALHYVFLEVDPVPAKEFFAGLEEGNDLPLEDPLLRLRNQILKPRSDRTYAQTPHHIAAITVKAFNLRREGKKAGALTFRSNEEFPVVNPRGLEGIK